MVMGDFNGDGKLDLAVTSGGGQDVGILLGNGFGGFGPPSEYLTGATPGAMALGDFDHNGQLDLAVADFASNNITVLLNRARGSEFALSAPNNTMAGSAIVFTVTALDQLGDTVTGYSGIVHFTSNDPQAVLPTDATLTNGTGTFSAILKTSGSWQITATDTAIGIIGTSNAIVVSPVAATGFAVGGLPSNTTAGAAFNFTVTAQDTFSNTVTGYTGIVHFGSSDSQAALPADTTLTNGAGTFTAILKTLGNQTISASDTFTHTIYGANATTVTAGVATHFVVSAISTTAAGVAFSVTVTTLNLFNITSTNYTGTVHFSTPDLGAGSLLPANYTFKASDAGVHIFSNGAKLVTAAAQTLTATDMATPSITGGTTVVVNPVRSRVIYRVLSRPSLPIRWWTR